MERTKLKVILAQLNVPYNYPTVPLAAGYLKAMAHREGLTQGIDIEILDNNISNFAGDARVISYLIERQPYCIGFTCYVWNIERTIYIINKIKKIIPKVKIVCGGSEASSRYKAIMSNNRNIDIIVKGEGELTFVELLNNFLFGIPKLKEIKGIVFRKKDKIILTIDREQIPDINVVPSPYLLGFIDPKDYECLMIETYRGCIEKCTYCNWRRNSRGIRYFAEKRIRNEIAFAKKRKVNHCEIIDPIFNLPNNIFRLSRVIKEINQDKFMSFSVEGRAEYINDKTVEILSQFNIDNIGIGLQTINPTALENINRWFNKKLFIRGIGFLKKKKIPFRLDIIIGLPGDTIESIIKTFHFVLKHNRKDRNYFEVLRVQPDTELKKQAKKFKLKYLKKIPYYVLSTNDLSHNELRKITKIWYRPSLNTRILSKLISFTRLPYLIQEDYKKIPMDVWKFNELVDNNLASDIFFEVDNKKQTVKQIENLAINLKDFITLDSQLFFKCKYAQIKDSFDLVGKFILQVSKYNPFSNLKIVIESDDFADIKFLHKLPKVIVHKPNYEEYKAKFYAGLQNAKNTLKKCDISIIQPFTNKYLRKMEEIPEYAEVIWMILVSKNFNWRVALRDALDAPYGSVLVKLDYSEDNLFFVTKVLRYIYKLNNRQKFIFFSDYITQLFYHEILQKQKDLQYIISSFKSLYNIVYVDSYLNATIWKCNVSSYIQKLKDICKIYKCNTKL